MTVVEQGGLSLPVTARRLSMFERLPAVYQDPARFRPTRVVEGASGDVTDWGVSAEDMLGVGSSGFAVADLQDALARSRHDPGPPDGAFGPRTADAVRAFQRQRDLTVDGLVGPQTLGELTAPLLRRFLDGLADVVDPVVAVLDNLAAYVSVDTAPDDFLEWLAWIVSADPMEDWAWDDERRRHVVATALELHRWRGTVRGIKAVVALHTGVQPDQVSVIDGGDTSWDPNPDAQIEPRRPRTVQVFVPPLERALGGLDMARIHRALTRALPVGFTVTFTVRGREPA